MKLSIIIVNYNVEFFLEQCLNSVRNALNGIDAETFVVDNNSVDGSVAMVKSRFPWVKLIENHENTGFAVANNQAIRASSGEYILLLNPDTLVQEDTFQKVIHFMDHHPDAGGLGVKMIDGKGNFLPESKRGLPTPSVAFYKIFGFSAFFPHSRGFGRYHLGYLDKDQNHEVDILSGAFMLLRREALDKTGLLDETFFMYGEDIDLSYRLTLAGYRNYYFSGTQIVHYKGESTKKGSLNYVYVFYKAMEIFARKHFSKKNARLFSFFINLAIWFRASIAIASRIVKWAWLPLLDVIIVNLLLFSLAALYEQYTGKVLEHNITRFAFPVSSLLWTIVFFFQGGYDRPFRYRKILKTTLYTGAISLIAYSLLPEHLRFSRLMVLAGSLSPAFWFLASRTLLQLTGFGFYGEGLQKTKKIAVVGEEDECERIEEMVRPAYEAKVAFHRVSPSNLNQLSDLVRIHGLHEIVFSGKDLSSQRIIHHMATVDDRNVDFKIAPPESLFIIGSNSIDKKGDYYMVEMTGINSAVHQRNKRIADLLLLLLLLVFLPPVLLVQKDMGGFLRNLWLVLIGRVSWVGFNKDYQQTLRNRKIKKGVLPVASPSLPAKNITRLNILYSRDYAIYKDLVVMLRQVRDLGTPAGTL